MKKAIKISLIILGISVLNFAILANTVQAVDKQQISIYTKGNFNRIIKYNGMLVKTAHAVYEENGVEYPAYCLDVELQGVGDKIATYETTNQGKITDVGLWRVIINGYPYKSLEELGVLNEEEAYTATKQSIYCYIYNRTPDSYSGVGEAGERTVNAMRKITENAKKSTEEIENQKVDILGDKEWKEEDKYITKQYEIKSNINISKYLVKLENVPKGTIISNYEDEQKQEFSSKEKFKISIPIENIKESGNFKIKIQTKMETKPIFYGKAPSAEYQDYALTAFSYEDIQIEKNEEYVKKEEPPEEEPPKEELPKEIPTVTEEIKKLPVTGM